MSIRCSSIHPDNHSSVTLEIKDADGRITEITLFDNEYVMNRLYRMFGDDNTHNSEREG